MTTEQVLPTMYARPVRTRWATDPTTTMEEEGVEPPPYQSTRTASGKVVVLPVSFLGMLLPQAPPRAEGVVFLEASVDQVGLAGECVATTASWPILWELWQEPEPDADPLRGTFAPPVHRDVLFTIDVDLESSQLRRWNPEVTLDRRDLDLEDA